MRQNAFAARGPLEEYVQGVNVLHPPACVSVCLAVIRCEKLPYACEYRRVISRESILMAAAA